MWFQITQSIHCSNSENYIWIDLQMSLMVTTTLVLLLVHLAGCISSIVRCIVFLILMIMTLNLVFNIVAISTLYIILPLLILICELHVLILRSRHFAGRQPTRLPAILQTWSISI